VQLIGEDAAEGLVAGCHTCDGGCQQNAAVRRYFFSKLCKAGLRSIQKACCFKNPGVSGGKDNYDADGEHGNDTAAAEDLGQLLISRVKAVEHDRAQLGGSDILQEKAEQTAGNDAGCHRQPDLDPAQ